MKRFAMVFLKDESPIYASVDNDEDLLEPLTATPDYVRIKAGNGRTWIVEKAKILKIRITENHKSSSEPSEPSEETVVIGGNVRL